MAATKNVLHGSPSAADLLELGVTGGHLKVAAGVDFLLKDVGPVVAAGNDQTNAAALPYTINVVSGADDAKGVILPAAAIGLVRIVFTSEDTVGLIVYPGAADTINGGTHTTGSVTIENHTMAIFVAESAVNWIAHYTVHAH